MLRRTLIASAGALAAPAIVETANAQSKFDWKQAKGTKLEVNFCKHPSADVMQAHQKEFEELTGIKVGSEQVPEQQQRPKVAMELTTGRPSFDVVSISLHVQKKLIEKCMLALTNPLISIRSDLAPIRDDPVDPALHRGRGLNHGQGGAFRGDSRLHRRAVWA